MQILLTGATGFVGGRLLPKLIASGHSVRCLTRSQSSAQKLRTTFSVEAVVGDLRDKASIVTAMCDCDVAYYLVHSMDADGDFRESDRVCASNFAQAAHETKLNRTIYLSGLADESEPKLSKHLASRIEVGRILRKRQSGNSLARCLELRAAMIIGNGSLSFRLVEHLCNRLPVMLLPKWLFTQTQPVGISDLLEYLLASLTVDLPASRVVEIGGANTTTYVNIFREYCQQQKLRRLMIPVPVLSTQLSAIWLSLVTPETAKVGRAMADGLRNPTIVNDDVASRLFDIKPMTTAAAIVEAIEEKSIDSSKEEPLCSVGNNSIDDPNSTDSS